MMDKLPSDVSASRRALHPLEPRPVKAILARYGVTRILVRNPSEDLSRRLSETYGEPVDRSASFAIYAAEKR